MHTINSKLIPLLISFFFFIAIISGCNNSDSPFEDGERYILGAITTSKQADVPKGWESGAEVEIYENWVRIYFKDGKIMVINRDNIYTMTVRKIQ